MAEHLPSIISSPLKLYLFFAEKSFKCTFDGCTYACVDNIGLKKHIRLMHTHKVWLDFLSDSITDPDRIDQYFLYG